MRIVVVGASVAGIRTVQALRARGYRGAITVIGEERHVPYDKPPLSKEMLDGSADVTPPPLLTPADIDALDVELLLGVRATGLDPVRRTVAAVAGAEIGYDTLIIATGVRPRSLPGAESRGNVHTLRTVDDAVALRRELVAGRRGVIVGAGFIGAEVASAARAHGVEVTLVEAQSTPHAQQFGPDIGRAMAQLHACHGVDLRFGVGFAEFIGSPRVQAVRLTDGTELAADFVVVGIGARPATDWLTTSGLPVEDGICCEESLCVPGFPDIYAVGDIARRRHPFYGEALRIEHWTNANDHASIVAAAILGEPLPRATLPYVWSDQYGKRIQIIGRPALGTARILRGDLISGDLVAGYADTDGVLVGALVVDNPRLLGGFRRAITGGQHIDEYEQTAASASRRTKQPR
ncbi:Putidaredoxin reductase [Nocardia cerradoensis]|uniref:Putidaredoxin reductase n=1 Tax=Nocardia cerradoensis TaxID=85688 RepID=A0A231GX94_9NOCA|nr:FAD-dependent oxidoreductase [Nocardia cerradoensis]OXR41253.1 Putidaredoxin reductase [Nocardia cerradoensis]